MDYLEYIIPAFVLVGAIVAIILSNKGSKAIDIVVPSTAPNRTDLKFGYYGTYGDQVSETADHTNLQWEPLWNGPNGAVVNMAAGRKVTVLDVDSMIFTGANGSRTIAPTAEGNMRGLFDQLDGAGVLRLVKIIVPCDEPNLPKNDRTAMLPGAAALIRRVAADYPALAGVRLGCIYAGGKPMPHVDLFDIVGFDDYEAGSGILSPGGAYDQLRAALRPDQRTWLIPSAVGQDPASWINFANSHPEVQAIVPFLWADIPWESFPGVRSVPEKKEAWIAAGKSLISA